MRKFSKTFSSIIESSDLNLNPISKVSGISNACLAKLVKGNINKPGKDKIVSVLLVLNPSKINRFPPGCVTRRTPSWPAGRRLPDE